MDFPNELEFSKFDLLADLKDWHGFQEHYVYQLWASISPVPGVEPIIILMNCEYDALDRCTGRYASLLWEGEWYRCMFDAHKLWPTKSLPPHTTGRKSSYGTLGEIYQEMMNRAKAGDRGSDYFLAKL